MSDTVNDLASESQDLAALLGLFFTDGVEINALANNFGWGTVVVSSLSLLGVLGLVKSSIKLALGLKYYSKQASISIRYVKSMVTYRASRPPRDRSLNVVYT